MPLSCLDTTVTRVGFSYLVIAACMGRDVALTLMETSFSLTGRGSRFPRARLVLGKDWQS